ncbi:MAG: AroM family protein [Anaerolineae bacterium]|nr:AroM family protein [Anaerolineae bacterium]
MTASAGRWLLGLVTIGQSPRDDILPQIEPHLPAGLSIRQMGALDGLTRDEIAGLAPGPNDYVLHTRLRDGSAVTVGRAGILPLLQGCLGRLEGEGANPIVLLCTGEFPELRGRALLIEPDRLLVNVVQALRPRRLGVFVPLSAQIEAAAEKWQAVGAELAFAAASPYGDEAEVRRAAEVLARRSPELVVMDCMGYTQAHKRLVVQATGSLVLLASGVIASVVGALLAQSQEDVETKPGEIRELT